MEDIIDLITKNVICQWCKYFLGFNSKGKMACLVEHGAHFDRLDSERLVEYDLDEIPTECEDFEEMTAENSTLGQIKAEAIENEVMSILMDDDE